MRDKTVDALKGIGLFFVFLGHTQWLDAPIRTYLYSFHMPLFFFLSGMVLGQESLGQELSVFIRRRALQRFIPYAVFGLITYIVWLAVVLYRSFYDKPIAIHPLKPLIGMFYGNGNHGWMEHNTLLWFFACLFVTEVIYLALWRNLQSVSLWIALFSLAAVGLLTSLSRTPRLPMSADVALVAILFYGSGHLLKTTMSRQAHPVLIAGLLASGFYLALYNGEVDMNHHTYSNFAIYVTAAFINIIGWFFLIRRLPQGKLLRYIGHNIGSNTVYIFPMQDVAFLCLYVIIKLFNVRIESPNIAFSVLFAFIAIIALILSLPMMKRIVDPLSLTQNVVTSLSPRK